MHHDTNIISSFRKLRTLNIDPFAHLNGKYPCHFNVPCLRQLQIDRAMYLKWDLDMLPGLLVLEELCVQDHPELRGDVIFLKVLKDTLRSVSISVCEN